MIRLSCIWTTVIIPRNFVVSRVVPIVAVVVAMLIVSVIVLIVTAGCIGVVGSIWYLVNTIVTIGWQTLCLFPLAIPLAVFCAYDDFEQ